MKSTMSLIVFVASLILGSSFTSTDIALGKWKKLGSKVVSLKLDRDVIQVGAKEGGFTKLKVVVLRGSINMHKMVVEYGNGTKDVIPLRHNFIKGSDTRLIDLQGGKRIIKDITFWYDTKNRSRNKARVNVYGRK